MQTRNLTPFLFGYKVCSRRPPRLEMTLIVRGRFSLRPGEPLAPLEGVLAQGALTAETFRSDDDERAGECLYPGDFADFKPGAEWILRGSCHTPGGAPLPVCPVRVSVGAASKSLRVVGPRAFSDALPGAAISAPLPFTTMPLDWTRAFGGPDHPDNPAGKGLGTLELPNLERPEEPIRSRADRPRPAGFGPLSPAWPARRGKRGEAYGASYRAARAPWYAEDFDWTYFHAAPPDQRLTGYFRGDEEVTLQNLHPAAPLFSVRLPGLRIRAVVEDVRGRVEDARMHLDTLFIEPDAGMLTLTWRGLVEVAEDDLTDVRAAVVASEPLAEPPRPLEHYREKLVQLARDPRGLEDLPPDMRQAYDLVRGEGSRTSLTSSAPPDTPAEHRAPRTSGAADPISALLEERLGGLHAPEQARVREFVAKLRSLRMPDGVNLDRTIADALARLPAQKQAAFLPATPAGAPLVPMGGALSALVERLGKLRRDAAARGTQLEGLEPLDALLADPRLQRLLPGYRAPGAPAPPPSEPGPGVDLSGQDLSGRDLSGRDLSGAKLAGALLSGTDLSRANLSGADLSRAVLFEARLEEADLSGANLSQANLMGARATGADLRGATLDQAILTRADLSRARLARARGTGVLLDGADLCEADGDGLRLESSPAQGIRLDRASLRGAELIACMCTGASAKGANLTGASLPRTSFTDADLEGASLLEARGEGAALLRAKLDGADLRYASLRRAHLSFASARGARFACADLREGRLYRASLERADFAQADLFGADLSKARLDGASFAGASLYGAKLHDASTAACDFRGANLRRVTPERA